MATKNSDIFKQLIVDLKSNNKEIIIKAIAELRNHGQKEAIKELLDIYILTNDQDIKNNIANLLFDLKDESVLSPLMSALSNKNYKSIQPFLVSILWQSSLDASEQLNKLIQIAIDGDYHTCLEVLTVIENFDSSFDEQDIMDAVYDLELELEEIEDDKSQLLYSLKEVVSKLTVDY